MGEACLTDDVRDDASVDIGESEIATGVTEGQSFVVHTQLMQDGGVQVVHFNRAFDRVLANFVSDTV